MKPLKLRLRGAIGIRDGLGVDEIEVDFSRFSSGLIGIVGPNGSGKSSLIESCHPYLQLASRDGALPNHFYLRDSFRDFTFELQGHIYRSYILIDAHTSKQEAYLYKDGEPLNDGKTGTYKEQVEKILGTPDLFFRSIFAAQGAASISSLTSGKRKELFMELLGLSRYDRYAEYAKAHVELLDGEVLTRSGRLEQINVDLNTKANYLERLQEAEETAIKVQNQMGEITKIYADTQDKLNRYEQQLAVESEKVNHIETLKKEIVSLIADKSALLQTRNARSIELTKEKGSLTTEINRLAEIIAHGKEIDTKVAELERLRTQEKLFIEKLEKLNEIEKQESANQITYQKAVASWKEGIEKIVSERRTVEQKRQQLINKFDTERDVLDRQLSQMKKTASLVGEVPCRTMPELTTSCKLLSSAVEAQRAIPGIEERFAQVSSDDYRSANGLLLLNQNLMELVLAEKSENDTPPTTTVSLDPERNAIGYNAEAHKQARNQLRQLEAQRWEDLSRECETAVAVIGEKKKQLEGVVSNVSTIETEYEIRTKAIDGNIQRHNVSIEQIRAEIMGDQLFQLVGETKKQLNDTNLQIANLEKIGRSNAAEISASRSQLERLDKLEVESKLLADEIGELQKKAEHWRILQRACSKDGIPALELDAAGPEVSRIANELLASTFGTRYQIAFETTKISRDKKKQLETFEIRVYGDDGEKKIEDLSGGERVWIESALTQSIAHYMRIASGRDISSRFIDEFDGALSPENAQNYLDMLRSSHEKGKYFYTFLITHRQELSAQIQQQISMNPEEHRVEFIY
jgi:exonuclease SbcC